MAGLALQPARADPPEPSYECANLKRLADAQGTRLAATQDEIWRLRDWLDACTRRVRPSERTLYTWGHRAKLNRMMTNERALFCAYDDARQARYNALRIGPDLLRIESMASQAPSTELLALAKGLSTDERLFDLYALAQARRDSRSHHRPEVLGSALLLAMYERWMPGFLSVQEAPLDRQETDLRSQRNGLDETSLQAYRLDGLLDAIKQYRHKQSEPGLNFLSSSSLGAGVSFSTSPVAFAQHFYDDDHMGLACRLPADDPRIVVDLRHVESRRFLKRGNVLLRTAEDLPDEKDTAPVSERPPLVPLTQFTEFVRPSAVESAARGRILLDRAGSNPLPVYADKCALEFRVACRPITHENIPCRYWQALKSHGKYVGAQGEKGGGPLRRYFRARATAGLAAGAAEQAYAAREQAKDAECAAALADASGSHVQTEGQTAP
jgi:hypothetical protein